MMNTRILFTFISLSLLFSSCFEEAQQSTISLEFPGVDQRLWVYFDRYENEAANRGISINLSASGIVADIQQIQDNGVAGQCSFGGNLPSNQIIIDSDFWNRSSEFGREFVIFHELGHCNLYRGHLEDSFNNGSCVSIMRSGLGTCRDAYSSETRSYYLDELFFNRE